MERHLYATCAPATARPLIDENFTIGVIDIEPEGGDPFLGFTFGTGARARHRTGATAPRDSIQLLGLGTGASVSETAPGAYAIQHAGGTVGTFQPAPGLVVGQDILFA